MAEMHALPDLVRLVLDPAGLREMLRELDGRATERSAVGRHHERRGPGRPLIDGEEVLCHGFRAKC